MNSRAVIFDLYGTLVDTLSYRELTRVLSRMAEQLGASPGDFVRAWIESFPQRASDVSRDLPASIVQVGRRLDQQFENEAAARASRTWFAFMESALHPRPSALAILGELKAAGLKTGVVSDCTAEVPELWQRNPLQALIDVAVFSCRAGCRKPDPRIYGMACRQLGVSPSQCLYLGDGSNRELSGATHVGMRAAQFRWPQEDADDAFRADPDAWTGPQLTDLTDIWTLLQA